MIFNPLKLTFYISLVAMFYTGYCGDIIATIAIGINVVMLSTSLNHWWKKEKTQGNPKVDIKAAMKKAAKRKKK